MILLGTLLPPSSLPQVTTWEVISIDSFVHFFMFMVLTFLMIVGLTKQYTLLKLRHFAVRYSLIISTLFGILIEVLQHFLVYGREGDIMDVFSNTIGCLIGIIIFKWVYIW